MLSTGVPNLDLILGGGIPEGDTILVLGSAGTGKTTLTMQMAFELARSGGSALFVSTLSEPPTRLIEHARQFAFFDENLIGKRVILLSVYPLVKESLDKLRDGMLRSAEQCKAQLLVLDGLMTLHDLHPDLPQVRTFVYELGANLTALGTTTVVTTSTGERPGGQPYPELTVADGIIELALVNVGTQTMRTIRVAKMRGQAPLLGQHSMDIDQHGVTVFPRVESLVTPFDIGLSAERVPLGLEELDAMMNGGPLKGSTTVLAGALGTGKTLTCLQWVAEGGRRGEKSLFVGFRESPAQLADKASVFGLDLRRLVNGGVAEVLHIPQVDLVPDEVTWQIVSRLDRMKPQRLAMDSITELEHAMVDERRRRGFMFALARIMRQRRVTALVTKEVAQVVGPELDFSETPLAMLAENLILMRYVEFRGELYRVLSVLKMRDSEHDHSIRQYEITERGIKVLSRIESGEGVLTGIARLPSEVRVKRGGRGGTPEGGLTR